jgi:uncharacterized protein (DUF2336 family)
LGGRAPPGIIEDESAMQPASLIDELETVLNTGSSVQRADILQRVTDLFLHGKESYREEHVALFDDVMVHLIDQIERYALIRLSRQLAPIGNAPTTVVHRLATSDDIAVSGPVIEKSSVLTDEVLVEIARTKSQKHLAAIAGRESIAETITDVLVDRGDMEVTRKITANKGARFSKQGFDKVVDKAQEDEELAEVFVNRGDVPPDVFEHLLRKAAEVVRHKLMRSASPQLRERITQTLSAIAAEAAHSPAHPQGDGYAAKTLLKLDQSRLKSHLCEVAQAGHRGETIEALSALSKLPIDAVRSLLRAGTEDGVLILCKGIGLAWPDVKNVLAVMSGNNPVDMKVAFDKYVKLTTATSERVIRFVKSCKAVSKADLQRML